MLLNLGIYRILIRFTVIFTVHKENPKYDIQYIYSKAPYLK